MPERKLPRAANGDQRGGLDVAHTEILCAPLRWNDYFRFDN